MMLNVMRIKKTCHFHIAANLSSFLGLGNFACEQKIDEYALHNCAKCLKKRGWL